MAVRRSALLIRRHHDCCNRQLRILLALMRSDKVAVNGSVTYVGCLIEGERGSDRNHLRQRCRETDERKAHAMFWCCAVLDEQ